MGNNKKMGFVLTFLKTLTTNLTLARDVANIESNN